MSKLKRRTGKALRTSILLALAAPALLAAAPDQEAQEGAKPSFPSQTDLVVVDVAVTTGKGMPVRGLSRGDFTVLEDGRPQTIESFEAVEVPASEPQAAPLEWPAVSSNTEAPGDTGRTFVIVFDDLNLSPQNAHQAKGAIASFLEHGVREGDRVMLVSSGGEAWWSSRMEAGKAELLTLLQRLNGRLEPDTAPDYISPWEALRIHVYRDQDVAFRVAQRLQTYNMIAADPRLNDRRWVFDNPFINNRSLQVYLGVKARTQRTLKVLERALKALSSRKGRKSAVLVSEGFVYDTTMEDFKRVAEDSLRSNVVLYFVDARGLTGLPVEMTAQFGKAPDARDLGNVYLGGTLLQADLESEGAQVLADESGGFSVKNANDLSSGIERIARESQAYYLLGYRPENTERDGVFREIKVKVSRSGVHVRARKGYYAVAHTGASAEPSPTTPEKPDFQPALDSPFPLEGVPLRMTHYVFRERLLGRATVLVATEVDLRNFLFRQEKDRFVDDLQFLLVVAHGESGEFQRADEAVEMRWSGETLARMKQTGYVIARPFDLEPGSYQARIAVRDRNGGEMGSVIHEFEVPEMGVFRASTPLLTDAVQQPEGGGRPRAVLRVRRSFAPGSTLYCQYEVYGAWKDPVSGHPRVAAGYEVRSRSGALVVRQVEPTPIVPSSGGELTRLIGTSLAGAPPGEYDLVLHIQDRVAGTNLDLQEPFRIEATGPSTASR